jgi:hypothetical protein
MSGLGGSPFEANLPMVSSFWITARDIRRFGSAARFRRLVVELLEDRRLLAPLPVQAQGTQLTAVAGSGVYSGTAALVATLTAAGKPLAGETVAFTLESDGTPIAVGSATTDATGVATLPGVILTGFNAGVVRGVVGAAFAGDATANDAASTGSGDLTVNPAPATLSLGGVTDMYDGMSQAVSVNTTPAGLAGVSVSYIHDLLPVTAPTTAGSYMVTATLSNANYTALDVTGTLVIDPATPPVIWANPTAIVYGTPLGLAQLDATSPVAGSFAYTQAMGTVLSAGGGQVLSGTFIPADTVDYTSAVATVSIDVLPATPAITWANPADILYGTALGPAQLDATASVPGSFAYSPDAGTIVGAGMDQTLSVTFTPIDANDYSMVTGTAMLNVLQATPVVTWPALPAIVYGTPLSASQLDATASTAGTFTYAPPAGTILDAGAGQALSVSFTPTDAADYVGSAGSVLLDVVPAPLTVTVNDASKVYGQANPAFSVSYGGLAGGDTPSALDGELSFATTATLTSDVGAYAVSASGLSSSNYAISMVEGTLTVSPADQTITWANPADIVYGTPLGAAQLDAAVSVVGPAPAGSLSYMPAAGTTLGTGPQILTVTAAATNDYNQASATVTINVAKATPVLTWASPADIVYGMPLGAGQLDASVSSPDAASLALLYSPAAGTILPAGSGQTLTVSTPATANDNAANATVTLNVAPATPGVSWVNPADVVYGTPLGAAQLDATASIPGTFTYAPGAGTVLDAGPVQTLTATFTPADASNFQPVTVTTLLNVLSVTLVVTANNAATTYGSPIPAFSGSVSGLVNNDPVGVAFSTTAAVGSPVGTYAIRPILVDPNKRMDNYQVVLDYGKLTITSAPLTVTSSSASITLGQPVPAFTVSYSGFVLGQGSGVVNGTPSFSLPTGAVGEVGTYPVMPGGLSAANYAITYVDGLLDVTAPPPALVTVANVRWQTRAVGRHKTARVLVVTFSAPLDPAAASDLDAYHLYTVSPMTKFGSLSSKPIPLAAAVYDPGVHSVILTPRGKFPNQALQLSIDAALVLDSQGRPIDAYSVGQPGGTYVATVKKR